MKKVTINVNGKYIHLVLYRNVSDWKKEYGKNGSLWDFPIEELLDGTIEPNEDVWYWLIKGRCYETTEEA